MDMYGYVGLCMAMYGYVWLCRAMQGYVWLCRAMQVSVGLCMAMYCYVGLCTLLLVTNGEPLYDAYTTYLPLLVDQYFTFDSKLGWHRLFLTVESTRGIRTLVVVFKLLEEMVAWGCRNGWFNKQFQILPLDSYLLRFTLTSPSKWQPNLEIAENQVSSRSYKALVKVGPQSFFIVVTFTMAPTSQLYQLDQLRTPHFFKNVP